MFAVAEPVPEELRGENGVEFMANVWLHVDAIPCVVASVTVPGTDNSFLITPSTAIFTKLPTPSTVAGATAAVTGAIRYLHPVRDFVYSAADRRRHTRPPLPGLLPKITRSKSTVTERFTFVAS